MILAAHCRITGVSRPEHLIASHCKARRDCERAVGQFLEGLREGGARIFHDVPAEGFNLDHVVISKHGIYVVETKTISKPSADDRVIYDGEQVTVAGFKPDRDPVMQAAAEATWLRRLPQQSTGPDHITLLPGVACHLRERAPLIRRLAQTEWLRFVLSLEQNQPVLGRAVGLSEFLFGSSRAALSPKVSGPLRELQHGRCFYCERSLPPAAAVDHFIPWSRYPRDLAHNLVLAHGTCNSRKSDLLGGEVYLGRWAQFVSDHDADLLAIGTEAGLLVDRTVSIAVAEWSYGHAERVQAEVWLGGSEYGHLSAGWRGLLA